MQYGSIGWAVGATLGYASAVQGKKRVILSVGDGSFQVTAQVSPAWKLRSQKLSPKSSLTSEQARLGFTHVQRSDLFKYKESARLGYTEIYAV
jgi:thiamine pyrophosphate-dependent acetolactate synthase large subunit-like protein